MVQYLEKYSGSATSLPLLHFLLAPQAKTKATLYGAVQ